ncbi:MAG: metal-sensitive transcriptional regulator [Candidatus Bathyarchaeota archaeon]|nr:MAG: metal-sensitive transcriptional regulator [Candidatus Bathyarchaeota archaeon]
MSHKQRKVIQNRLSRVEGHIRGIKKMVDADRDCSEILLQLAAVKAALDKVRQIVLEDHLESCLVDAIQSGNYEAQLRDLKHALAQIL